MSEQLPVLERQRLRFGRGVRPKGDVMSQEE